jgi:hypothetical protein
VKDLLVAIAEFACIAQYLVRVPDEFAVGDGPRLVTKYAFAVFAGLVSAVSIAMKPRTCWL